MPRWNEGVKYPDNITKPSSLDNHGQGYWPEMPAHSGSSAAECRPLGALLGGGDGLPGADAPG
jgi:hypothetical protein